MIRRKIDYFTEPQRQDNDIAFIKQNR